VIIEFGSLSSDFLLCVFLTRGVVFLAFVLVSQSVKEVLQSLVDDNLVQMDKIGSSNCRCSGLLFPIDHLVMPLFNVACAAWPDWVVSLLELPFPEGCDRKFLFNIVMGGTVYSNNPSLLTLRHPIIRGLTDMCVPNEPYKLLQMQNRLDGAAEAQAASEKQLAELQSAIAAERAARPESVNSSFFSVVVVSNLSYRFPVFLGSTQRGTWSIGLCEENVNRAAR
jgi:hypothetical protein